MRLRCTTSVRASNWGDYHSRLLLRFVVTFRVRAAANTGALSECRPSATVYVGAGFSLNEMLGDFSDRSNAKIFDGVIVQEGRARY